MDIPNEPVKKTKYSTRDLVTIAVFGTLWGVIEMTLGSVIKSLDIPFAGMTLGAIGLAIAMIGRLFVPKKGSVVFIGLIAIFLKMFSVGGFIIGPMIGIAGEAALAELVLSIARKAGRFPFIMAGVAGSLWTVAQPFATGPVLYGRSLFTVWLDLIDKMTGLLGFNIAALLLIIYLLIHIAAGFLSGMFAWDAGRKILARMRPTAPEGSTG